MGDWLRYIAFWSRIHWVKYGALVVFLLALETTAAYSRLGSTTTFTADKALAEFRARQSSFTPPPPESVTGANAQTGSGPASTGPTTGKPSATSDPTSGAAEADTCDWACPTSYAPPLQGVYDYWQCSGDGVSCTGAEGEAAGTEKIGAVERDFPNIGRRLVTVTGPASWNNAHVYADEPRGHREEFDLTIDQTGVYDHSYKVDITFAGTGGGTNIRQVPPFKLTTFPLALGVSWSGSWRDKNGYADGDYECRVISKDELSIGGVKIKTWAVETQLTLKGPKDTGNVLLRYWLAPDVRMTVQEFYDQALVNEGVPYEGRWMVTLRNLEPRQ